MHTCHPLTERVVLRNVVKLHPPQPPAHQLNAKYVGNLSVLDALPTYAAINVKPTSPPSKRRVASRPNQDPTVKPSALSLKRFIPPSQTNRTKTTHPLTMMMTMTFLSRLLTSPVSPASAALVAQYPAMMSSTLIIALTSISFATQPSLSTFARTSLRRASRAASPAPYPHRSLPT